VDISLLVLVTFFQVVLDHESHQNGSFAYELVHCQLTLFHNYWPMHEVS